MIRKLIIIVVFAWANNAIAQAVFIQSDNLPGGFSNKDGKAIQLAITFDKPVAPNDSFQLIIDGRKVLDVMNNTNSGLQRFITRLRLNPGEQVTLKIRSQADSSISLNPDVKNGFTLPAKDEYVPSPRVSVVNEAIAKGYGARIGDCIYLFSGVSNSGARIPKKIYLKTNAGEVQVMPSDRVSFSPFFIVGLSEELSQCSATMEEGSVSPYVAEKTSIALEQAQSKCLDLGFKSNTEEFGKCVLRLSK